MRVHGHSNLSTVTDPEGQFTLTDVPEGNHTLQISKNLADSTFTEFSYELLVEDDLILDALRLPQPAYLFEGVNITHESTELRWTPTDAYDFREYKIYRHNTSGLDETTGQLVHVATGVLDTVFIDNSLEAFTDYYYRVYVMNEFGKLGGSNIVKVSTPNRNLFSDGGFEKSQRFEDFWILETAYTGLAMISDSLAKEGEYSMKITPNVMVSHIPMSGVQSGEMFRLNFYYRVTGDSIAYTQFDDRSFTLSHMGVGGSNVGFRMFDTFTDIDPGEGFDTGWLYFSGVYLMKEDTPLIFFLTLSATTEINMWFDNFELLKVVQ